MNKSTLRLFLTGFTMGSADIVPGVSGGTIAFILGIYETLINSIKIISTDTLRYVLKFDIKKAWQSIPFKFLLPVFAGIFTAIFTFSKLIAYLLANQPVYIWSFFFGLVVISIFIVSKKIKIWNKINILAMLISTIGAFLIVGAVPYETANTLPNMFFAGAIAICAMILPGISGSFLLIIMGKYHQLLNAVNNHDLLTLIVFIAGAIIGLGLFSRLLSFLFTKYHDLTVAILTGFMIGSLRKVWPWKETVLTRINSHGVTVPIVQQNVLPNQFDFTIIIAIILALTSAILMWKLSKFEK